MHCPKVNIFAKKEEQEAAVFQTFLHMHQFPGERRPVATCLHVHWPICRKGANMAGLCGRVGTRLPICCERGYERGENEGGSPNHKVMKREISFCLNFISYLTTAAAWDSSSFEKGLGSEHRAHTVHRAMSHPDTRHSPPNAKHDGCMVRRGIGPFL